MNKFINTVLCTLMILSPVTFANKTDELEQALQRRISMVQTYVNKKMYRLIQLSPRHFYYYKYRPFTDEWYNAEMYFRTVHPQEFTEYLVANGNLEELKEVQAYSTFNSLSK